MHALINHILLAQSPIQVTKHRDLKEMSEVSVKILEHCPLRYFWQIYFVF